MLNPIHTAELPRELPVVLTQLEPCQSFRFSFHSRELARSWRHQSHPTLPSRDWIWSEVLGVSESTSLFGSGDLSDPEKAKVVSIIFSIISKFLKVCLLGTRWSFIWNTAGSNLERATAWSDWGVLLLFLAFSGKFQNRKFKQDNTPFL